MLVRRRSRRLRWTRCRCRAVKERGGWGRLSLAWRLGRLRSGRAAGPVAGPTACPQLQPRGHRCDHRPRPAPALDMLVAARVPRPMRDGPPRVQRVAPGSHRPGRPGGWAPALPASAVGTRLPPTVVRWGLPHTGGGFRHRRRKRGHHQGHGLWGDERSRFLGSRGGLCRGSSHLSVCRWGCGLRGRFGPGSREGPGREPAELPGVLVGGRRVHTVGCTSSPA